MVVKYVNKISKSGLVFFTDINTHAMGYHIHTYFNSKITTFVENNATWIEFPVLIF